MKELIIIGAGGHAKVVIDAVKRAKSHIIRSLVDTTQSSASSFAEWNVDFKMPSTVEPNCEFIVAIGDNAIRAQLYADLLQTGWAPATIIHPSAIIAENVSIGAGSLLCAGSIIGPDSMLGENCIVNTGASIDHDCTIGDHCHVCPGARLPGACKLGEGVLIGTAATAIPNIVVGDWAVVGAGSVLIKNVESRSKVVGFSRVIPFSKTET